MRFQSSSSPSDEGIIDHDGNGRWDERLTYSLDAFGAARYRFRSMSSTASGLENARNVAKNDERYSSMSSASGRLPVRDDSPSASVDGVRRFPIPSTSKSTSDSTVPALTTTSTGSASPATCSLIGGDSEPGVGAMAFCDGLRLSGESARPADEVLARMLLDDARDDLDVQR